MPRPFGVERSQVGAGLWHGRRRRGHAQHHGAAGKGIGGGTMPAWLGPEGEHGALQLLEPVPALTRIPISVKPGVLAHRALPVRGRRGQVIAIARLVHHLPVKNDVVDDDAPAGQHPQQIFIEVAPCRRVLHIRVGNPVDRGGVGRNAPGRLHQRLQHHLARGADHGNVDDLGAWTETGGLRVEIDDPGIIHNPHRPGNRLGARFGPPLLGVFVGDGRVNTGRLPPPRARPPQGPPVPLQRPVPFQPASTQGVPAGSSPRGC